MNFCQYIAQLAFFREKIAGRIALLSGTKSKSFFADKNAKKEELNLQIAKISGEKADTANNKIYEAFISRISKKRTKKMDVKDFVIIRGQQGFETDKAINPIETKIQNDRIQNMFDKYQKNTFWFVTEGFLFSSSIKNNTEKIFLATNGLADAKYGLINDEL